MTHVHEYLSSSLDNYRLAMNNFTGTEAGRTGRNVTSISVYYVHKLDAQRKLWLADTGPAYGPVSALRS